MIAKLKAKGLLDHLLLSQDRNRKPELCKYVGPGYSDIIYRFNTLIRKKGITENDIHILSVCNPAKTLVIQKENI